MFDNPDIFYSTNPKIVLNDDWIIDQSKIAKLKQHNLAIIDMSSEHYGVDGIDHVYDALDHAGVNFLLLSHNPNDHKKFARMFFYPHWYFLGIEDFIIPEFIPVERKFLWSCQNSNPRPHRIYNFLHAVNSGWIKKSIFTMHNDDACNANRFDDYPLSNTMISQWEHARLSLPIRKKLSGTAQTTISGAVFTDAYINLVTEVTIIPRVFLSEKTWKPIAAQQLFLIFGNPGSIETLRAMGVDTYDDIIDHSYDSECDWQIRLEKIYTSLQKLESQNLSQIYKDTAARRLKNAELCLSGQFGQIYKTMLDAAITTFIK